MFIGQQFMQNVLGYSTLDAGLAILRRPSSWCWWRRFGPARALPRFALTLLLGYLFCLLSFLTMLLLWKQGTPYWQVGPGLRASRVGIGLFGTRPRAR